MRGLDPSKTKCFHAALHHAVLAMQLNLETSVIVTSDVRF
jgi:hypothetical protein